MTKKELEEKENLQKEVDRFVLATSRAVQLLGGDMWLVSAVASAGDTLYYAESASIIENWVKEHVERRIVAQLPKKVTKKGKQGQN